MKTLILSLVLFVILIAKSAHSQLMTNSENKTPDIQLSISLTNNVIVIGTNAFLQCQIKNSSINMISLRHPLAQREDTHLFLIDNSGKTVELTPSSIVDVGSEMSESTVKSAETYQWVNPFTISTNFAVGKYKLEAIRYFYSMDSNWHRGKLVSDLLNVQIK
ncbi:MAG TPA: hypothetical protein VIK59_08990 [Verrucomicrobiae bacterium]